MVIARGSLTRSQMGYSSFYRNRICVSSSNKLDFAFYPIHSADCSWGQPTLSAPFLFSLTLPHHLNPTALHSKSQITFGFHLFIPLRSFLCSQATYRTDLLLISLAPATSHEPKSSPRATPTHRQKEPTGSYED